jgi:aminopeptidase N
MRCFSCSVALSVLLLCATQARASGPVHHTLSVTIEPEQHRIAGIDTVTLSPDTPENVSFLLHAGFIVESASALVHLVPVPERGNAAYTEYRVERPGDLRSFTLRFDGTLLHSLAKARKQQAIEDTDDSIGTEGVSLSGSSRWYPDFGSDLLTFTIDVRLPRAWDAVSQGERTKHDLEDTETFVQWKSPEAQEEIYLEAAPFYEYRLAEGKTTAYAFLRRDDQELATQYLEATPRYIDFYSRLIGPYPYKKFALVENFRETGFGMPSFTLLGPSVIRLPFIVNTSYPHEILHNWWGNGVYPDSGQGNWTEGLTAYLADHLLKEQQGAGAEYRMTSLQKYADYAAQGRDFPLTEFRVRHSAATEAVGYGKALMVFHMLRRELGDDLFRTCIQEFYREYRFKFASWSDLRRAFEAASDRDLKHEFNQWLARAGAPQLKIARTNVAKTDNAYVLSGTLEQAQSGDPYQLHVPIAVTMDGQERAYQTMIDVNEIKTDFTVTLQHQPVRLDVDPEFDVFRKLTHEETPAAISEVLGAQKMIVVLPGAAAEPLLSAYRTLASLLKMAGPDKTTIKIDSDLKKLPEDATAIVLGWENRFANAVKNDLAGQGVSLSLPDIQLNNSRVPRKEHSFAFAFRDSMQKNSILFIAGDTVSALTGLGRKLPHYHKYSYLVFEGKEPVNTVKGRWLVRNSPMTVFLTNIGTKPADMAVLAPREALAEMKSP